MDPISLVTLLAGIPFEILIPILAAGVLYYGIKRFADFLDKSVDCDDEDETRKPGK